MNSYELKFSNLLKEMTEQVAEFVKTNYGKDNYVEKSQEESQEETFDVNNIFENVDNSKIELVEFGEQQPKINKTLLWVIGGIILYNLIRGK